MNEIKKNIKQSINLLHDKIENHIQITPRIQGALRAMDITNMLDLYSRFPRNVISRQHIVTLSNQYDQERVIISGTVQKISGLQMKGLLIVQILTFDQQILHVYYRYSQFAYLSKLYPLHTQVHIAGKLQIYKDHWSMFHPEHVKENIQDIPTHEPIYSRTSQISQVKYQNIIDQALQILPDLPEWSPTDILQQNNWMTWRDSILTMHRKLHIEDTQALNHALERLTFDELLAQQLAVAHLIRNRQRHHLLRQTHKDDLITKFLQQLPFKLSASQNQAIKNIGQDLQTGTPMVRLLQGDVGSGKTVVAMVAMLHAIENHQQAALLAPTITLARQHYDKFKPLLDKIGVSVKYLTSQLSSGEQKQIKKDISDNKVQMVIGTHALLQKKITFANLGLFVIDEQHRFGIEQRNAITDRFATHVLMMTATPIPRTLLLAKYSDMSVSNLDNHNPNSSKITTVLVSSNQMTKLIKSIKGIMDSNKQVFWICPTIDSENIKHLNVKQRTAYLKQELPTYGIAMLHGSMTKEQQEQSIKEFKNGKASLLVSTTMIEVGIDIPQATVMVIENPEQFGLLQLHQMRGRVGRGTSPGYCVLFYHAHASISDQNLSRLKFFKTHHQGIEIANTDFELRGGGDVFGSNRQSGRPDFLFAVDANIIKRLLPVAHNIAQKTLNSDDAKSIDSGYKLLQELFFTEYTQSLSSLRH